jgi:hypothetical protein
MRGAGLVARFEDLAAMTGAGETVAPDARRQARYEQLYAAYQRLYDRVRPEFASVAALQAELAG